MSASAPVSVAQQPTSQDANRVAVHGVVLDSAGKVVGNALVRLESAAAPVTETTTDAAGAFAFSAVVNGSYVITAEKSGLRSRAAPLTASASGDQRVQLVLDVAGADSTAASSHAMEFADTPNFTVAGVTDWTAVGGHGSDSILRTSEDLARETLSLKAENSGQNVPGPASSAKDGDASESELRAALAGAPGSFEANRQLGEYYFRNARYRDAVPLLQAAYQIDAANRDNAYELALAYKEAGDFSQARDHVQKLLAIKDDANLHRALGEIDEKMGDALAAVREDERAVRLEPSEQNYFVWGSELLLHRAVWQAAEVFKSGAKAHPTSARMLAALGTAQFAGALYDEAAVSLCSASDLNPADTEPYLFMGRIEMAAPKPLACIEPRLARFVQEQPGNSLANYFYAMAILKRQKPSAADPRELQQVETLLNKAVTIDGKCGDAYLQLGILSSAQHQLQKAIGLYIKAIDADPQLGEAYYRLGVAYDRIGAPEKAAQEFQLHDEIEKVQAANVERQRREVKQFLVVLANPKSNP